MQQELQNSLTDKFLKKDIPHFLPGDTIRVVLKIEDYGVSKGTKSKKERVQAFEGIVLSRTNKATITEAVNIYRVVSGIKMRRLIMLHSPTVISITVVRYGSVRRAKLYYLCRKTGKAKVKESIKRRLQARALAK